MSEFTKDNNYCACGFPQSNPIPHEHDQTLREKAIIKHFRDSQRDLLAACKKAIPKIYHDGGFVSSTEIEAIEILEAAIADAKKS